MRRVKVYPHNDLINLAYYHLQVLEGKAKSGDRDAISLDSMSCLVSLAFTSEALINLVGHKRIDNWNEWWKFQDKAKKVCTRAGLSFRKCVEPFKTVWELKTIRDSMAHGKPVEFDSNAKTRHDVFGEMQCSWDKYITPEYARHAYDKVKEFEKLLFDGCGISKKDTITGSVHLP